MYNSKYKIITILSNHTINLIRGNNVGDNGGAVWYRSISQEDSGDDSEMDTNAAILARSAIEVETNFDVINFRPTELFIATWDGVGYYERMKDKVGLINIHLF